MGTMISFNAIALSFTISIFLLTCLLRRTTAVEIIIGGGQDENLSPPPSSDCPPPPPPPCYPPPPPPPSFESKRIELVYPVIQKFKHKIKHDPKGITKTWVGTDICRDYKGFFCARVPDYKVQALAGVKFNGFKFAGDDLRLDEFIDELPDITVFHANSNHFTGKIPSKIGGLRYLYELDLSNNKFTGEFPAEVLGATKLTFLDLRFNSFSGLVPPQVFMLDLDVLFINNNNFMQKLPENLGATSALYVTLAGNNFVGPIPRSIGKASKTLVEVLLVNNSLSGCLPCEIGNLTKATVFDVGCNQLTGPIPYSFACLSKIQILNLAQNKFYGPVPEMVCELPNLLNFSLSYNYFTDVGPACKELIKKKVLDVRMNCILGLPMQRPMAECEQFFSRPKTCPDERVYSWNPCGHVGPNSLGPSDKKWTAPAALPRSYEALIPHRL